MKIDFANTQGINNSNLIVQRNLKKATEKLATGYTINRAADNASGLAISEKMRSLIRGLSMAKHNSEDGINLIKVGEASLGEVHDMLARIREMAVQSSNGTYTDEGDREGLQRELEAITEEVDRIAKSTEFNGIHLFQEDGLEEEWDISSWDLGDYKNLFKALHANIYLASDDEPDPDAVESSEPLFHDLATDELFTAEELGDVADDGIRIVYEEVVYDFSTTQTPSGSSTVIESSATAAKGASQCNALAETLKKQIVPNVVNSILSKYGEAFGYLTGSSIGIGLRMYQDSSNTLASVYVGASGNTATGVDLAYTLNVNVNSLQFSGDQLTDESRRALESTIAHEMIHAFMDEATTSGMVGWNTSLANVQKFPMWFVEGMAQSASGPGNWVTASGGLGLNSSSTESQISSALASKNLASSSSSTAAQYGTGYLACMYLGYATYLHEGGSIDMTNPTEAASKIAQGAAKFMKNIIEGASLDDTIKKYTSFGGINDFQNRFASDSGTVAFVKSLLPYCTDGYGGLISGNLANNDPVPNGNLSVSLFELDTTNTKITNKYPSDVNVVSGGAATTSGVAPTTGTTPVIPPVSITYPENLFTVTGGTKGVDWDFDTSTGTLKILTGTAMTISGGTATIEGAKHSGEIVVKDNIGNVNISIKDLNIDQTTESDPTAGISLGKGNNVALNIVKGSSASTIKAGGTGAGIQLGEGTNLTLTGSTADATLDVTGGSSGGAGIGAGANSSGTAGNITIKSGTVKATGGANGAGIGAGKGGKLGNITVEGGTVTATGGSNGAGIGCAGNGGTVNDIVIKGGKLVTTGGDKASGIGGAYQTNLHDITIQGGDITARSGSGAAAIGAGYAGCMNDINVSGGKIDAVAGEHGAGIGGGWTRSSVIGNITISGGDITAKSSYHGTGIGAGCQGTVGNIIIKGNSGSGTNVVAVGGDDGAAIGGSCSGKAGTITIGDGNAANDAKLKVKATGGKNGSGIGSGSNGLGLTPTGGKITINGGVIEATGSTDAAGIGSGKGGINPDGIEINGGVITTIGGMTNGGGNLGGYTDSSRNPASLVIKEGVSIQAGSSGEGLYNTTGAKLPDGTPIYAYKFSADNLPAGTLPDGFTFPVTAKTTTGMSFSWNDPIQHETTSAKKNEVYFWMSGEDHILEVEDGNGNKVTLDLQWYPDAGMWRIRDLQEAPPAAVPPGYSTDPSNPSDPGEDENKTDEKKLPKGIILQVGPRVGNIVVVPQFYFSAKALKMEELDISTRDNANDTISKVDVMIDRISTIRNKYGALQNDLEHSLNSLGTAEENLQAAESKIRDTDMASEYIKYVRDTILMQSGQSVLAQANMNYDKILSILQF